MLRHVPLPYLDLDGRMFLGTLAAKDAVLHCATTSCHQLTIDIGRSWRSEGTNLGVSEAQLSGQIMRCQYGNDATQRMPSQQDPHIGRFHWAGLNDALDMRNNTPAGEARALRCFH